MIEFEWHPVPQTVESGTYIATIEVIGTLDDGENVRCPVHFAPNCNVLGATELMVQAINVCLRAVAEREGVPA